MASAPPAAAGAAAASASLSASAPSRAPRFSEQPRHFHFQQSNKRQRPEEDELKEAPRTRADMHKDAWQCVNSFLQLRELSRVMAVSRGWQSILLSTPSLSRSVTLYQPAVAHIALSRLGKHVGELYIQREPDDEDGGPPNEAPTPELHPDSLALLHIHMGQLRVLDCTLLYTHVEPRFPSRLEDLSIDTRIDLPPQYVNGVIAAVGMLQHLQSCTLDVPLYPSCTLAPLSRLDNLRSLRLCLRGPGEEDAPEPSDAQVEQCRSLANLDELSMYMTPSLLERLLRPPHALRWKKCSTPRDIDAEVAAILTRLSTLTELGDASLFGGFFSCESFAWLVSFPNLAKVSLAFAPALRGSPTALPSLLDTLPRCSSLTDLTLRGPTLSVSEEELATLLPKLQQLRSLHLAHQPLRTLAFLQAPSLALTLERLEISDTLKPKPPLSALRVVHKLRRLKSLHLERAFAQEIEAYVRSLYSPPSDLLPNIEQTFIIDASDSSYGVMNAIAFYLQGQGV